MFCYFCRKYCLVQIEFLLTEYETLPAHYERFVNYNVFVSYRCVVIPCRFGESDNGSGPCVRVFFRAPLAQNSQLQRYKTFRYESGTPPLHYSPCYRPCFLSSVITIQKKQLRFLFLVLPPSLLHYLLTPILCCCMRLKKICKTPPKSLFHTTAIRLSSLSCIVLFPSYSVASTSLCPRRKAFSKSCGKRSALIRARAGSLTAVSYFE